MGEREEVAQRGERRAKKKINSTQKRRTKIVRVGEAKKGEKKINLTQQGEKCLSQKGGENQRKIKCNVWKKERRKKNRYRIYMQER